MSDARIHEVSARTVSWASGSSGGAYSAEWLSRIIRSSVDPARAGDSTMTGAVSRRLPSGGAIFRAG